MRAIDPTLTSALSAGTGKPFLKGYIGYADGTVTHSAPVISYKLSGSTLEFEMAYDTDIAGDQTHIWLERGLTIAGTTYSLTTGRFRLLSQRYLPNGRQVAAGSLFPKQYYSAPADDTYQNVISAFCSAFGKTAVFKDPAADWLAYQFFPTGKSVILNDANRFANLLAQKYLIFLCDNGSEEVLFHSCAGSLFVDPDFTLSPVNDFFRDKSARTNRCLIWRDENESVHTAGSAADPLHNLGFLPSTASAPARRSTPFLFEARIRPDLRLQDGDIVQIASLNGFALVTEEYVAGEHQASAAHSGSMRSRSTLPRWETIVTSNEVFRNTAGGALPSTIERVSNYTPLNTGMFNGVLSTGDNNLQAAMDTLDDHSSYVLQAFAASFSPADSTTYYFGGIPSEAPQTTAARTRIQIPHNGRIKAVRSLWIEYGGVAGSGETITLNVRVNNTTSYQVAQQSNTGAAKGFSNLALDIAVTTADYIEVELVCPAWATNPTLVRIFAAIYIET